MSGNSFGKIFKVTTFGESHGRALGCVIDGCPAGLALGAEDIERELRLRRPGGGGASTTRKEADDAEILSGVFQGKTLGSPIAILVRNTGQKSGDYADLKDIYRPGHADWCWEAKYGLRDYNGGGRSSARETVARVAAGAVAKVFLARSGVSIRAWTQSIAGIEAPREGDGGFSFEESLKNPLRVPCAEAARAMAAKIEEFRARGDSAGGIVACSVKGLPAGLGEPVFDKLDALLAQAMLSIGAAKGVEFGSGFGASLAAGSENNDAILPASAHPAAGKRAAPAANAPLLPDVPAVCFASNNSGGVLGGISNGMPLNFRVAFKPVPSIAKKQQTVDREGKARELVIKGRHDVCVCPRAVCVVEAMAALVLADLMLLSRCSISHCLLNLQ